MIYRGPSGNYVLVNYKVGYSTHENLNRKGLVNVVTNIAPGKQIFMLVRDPIKRVESFYKDKFVRQIYDWRQDCQREMEKYWPKEKLLAGEFRFTDLINCLSRGYSDFHVDPQYLVLSRLGNPEVKIIHLESPNEMKELALGLGLPEDIYSSVHQNNTENIEAEIEWSEDDLTEFYNLYKRDFELGGYSI